MRDLKKENITIIGILVCWSENSEIEDLRNKKLFSSREFEIMCKKHDYLINSDGNRLGYDKTKYQVLYFINTDSYINAKSYTDRVDLGDGEKYMPTEDTMKQNIVNIENKRKQSKNQTEEFEL